MGEPENIQRFNEVVAQVLAQLYEKFPVREELDCFQLGGYDTAHVPDVASGTFRGHVSDGVNYYRVELDGFVFARHTILWLFDAGYLKVGGFDGRYFGECFLTSRGLELMKSVPSSVDNSKSLGEQLTEEVKKGAMAQAGSVVSSAMTRLPWMQMLDALSKMGS